MSTTTDQPWLTFTLATDTIKGDWKSEYATVVYGLPVQDADAALRQAALVAGVDLHNLLDAAAAHFRDDVLNPFSGTLTQSDLESLINDDDNCF